ncbi:SOS response-associated peptidase [Qiania dongpingensis]|uniref:Abasic site processing protein n=1 Tax=Qiania dongpingensis TaxID=2763669 RepID=A0A7G9G609_9FIRM|nr:SOS response-associated peptidase [Qiania dongpingensis]QNM06241.1 SOS response-associated peptidase [Qiania dongpingensis]
MCGRYSLFTDEENQEILRIVNAINARFPGNTMKTGEIFPTNTAPILSSDRNEIIPRMSIWGFPRFGAKGVIINARSETAAERPTFKKSLHSRRCAVPTTGFYEWSKDKTKYRFNLPHEKVLYLAGLYNEFEGENKFVILTTEANRSMADVHNRMPVILPRFMVEDWVLSDDFALSYVHENMPALEREALTEI